MELHGTRFGTLEFEEEDIIHLKEPLLGFPLSHRFLLFPYSEMSSYLWLQSLDEPEIAFLVLNPFDVNVSDGLRAEIDKELLGEVYGND